MKKSLKSKLLAVLLAVGVLTGTAIAAAATSTSGEDFSTSLTEFDQEQAVEQPQAQPAAGEGGQPIAPYGADSKQDLLYLRPMLIANDVSLTVGASNRGMGYLAAGPAPGTSYENVEITVRANGMNLYPYTSASWEEGVEVKQLENGDLVYTIEKIEALNSSSVFTLGAFQYSFDNYTPNDFVGSIEIVSVKEGNIEVGPADFGEEGVYVQNVTASATNTWTATRRVYANGSNNTSSLTFKHGTETEMEKYAVPANQYFYFTSAEGSSTSGRAYTNKGTVTATLGFGTAYTIEAYADALTNMAPKQLAPQESAEWAGLFSVTNTGSYNITVSVTSVSAPATGASYVVLSISSEDDTDLKNINFNLKPIELTFREQVTKESTLTTTTGRVYLTTSASYTVFNNRTVSVSGSTVYLYYTKDKYTEPVTPPDPEPTNYEQQAKTYIAGISKTAQNYYFDLDGNTNYGFNTPEMTHPINRPYITNVDIEGDPNPGRVWFSISGLQNNTLASVSRLEIEDAGYDAENQMAPTGFMPATFTDAGSLSVPTQIVEIKVGDTWVEVYKSVDGGAPTVDGSYLDTHTVTTKTGDVTFYTYKSGNYPLRFVFEDIASKETKTASSKVSANPMILFEAVEGAGDSLGTASQATFANNLEILAHESTADVDVERTANGSVIFRSPIPATASGSKAGTNLSRPASEYSNTTPRPGDTMQYTLTFTTTSAFLNTIMVVDELGENLVLDDSVVATKITINNKSGGSTLTLADVHSGVTPTSETATQTVYEDVKPLTGIGPDGAWKLEDRQMMFAFSGVLLQGDSITIVYTVKVKEDISEEAAKTITNKAWADTRTNGYWTGNGGTRPPTWVPGDENIINIGSTSNGVSDKQMLGFVNLTLTTSGSSSATVYNPGMSGTLTVAGGFPQTDINGKNPAFIVQIPGTMELSAGISAAEYYKVNASMGKVNGSSVPLTEADYELSYYDKDGNPLPSPEGAVYLRVEFPGREVAMNDFFTFKVVMTCISAGESTTSVTASARLVVGEVDGALFGGPMTRYNTTPTQTSLTTDSPEYRLLGYSADGNARTITPTAVTALLRSVSFSVKAETKSISVSQTTTTAGVDHGANISHTLAVRNTAASNEINSVPIYGLVYYLPEGQTAASTPTLKLGTANVSTTLYTVTYDEVDGQQRVKLVFKNPYNLAQNSTLTLAFNAKVDTDGLTVPATGYTVTTPASVYVDSNVAVGGASIVQKGDETGATRKIWWDDIDGLAYNGSYLRAETSRNNLYKARTILPGVVTARVSPNNGELNTITGVNAVFSVTVYNTSTTALPMEDYDLYVILPSGVTFNGMATGIEPTSKDRNNAGLEVLHWSGEDLGTIPTPATYLSMRMNLHFNADCIGDIAVTSLLLVHEEFPSVSYGTRVTKDTLETSGLLAGTGYALDNGVQNSATLTLRNAVNAVAGISVQNTRNNASATGNGVSYVTARRDDTLRYTFKLTNMYNSTFSDIVFYNAMPAANDTFAFSDLPRGSEFVPELVFDSFSATNSNFTVYLRADVPATESVWLGNDGWTALSAWDRGVQPKAFKVVFTNASLSSSGSSLSLSWDLKVPKNMTLEDQNKAANNSAGFSFRFSSMTVTAEPNYVGARFEPNTNLDLEVTKVYEHADAAATGSDTFTFTLQRQNGSAWDDVDMNDYTLAGGAGAVKGDGNFTITTDVNDSASVTLKGLEEGVYRVEEQNHLPDDYVVSTSADSVYIWDTNPAQPYNFTITNSRVQRSNLVLQKTVTDNSESIRKDSFTLKLQVKDGSGWVDVDLRDYTLVSADTGVSVTGDGKLQVSNANQTAASETFEAEFSGFLPGTYQLVEPEVNGLYWTAANSAEVSVADGNSGTLTAVNTRVLPSTLKLQKVVTDTTSLPRNDTFTLQLQQKVGTEWEAVDLSGYTQKAIGSGVSISGGNMVVSSSGAGGTFEAEYYGFLAGEYRLVELNPNTNYWAVADSATVTLTENGNQTLRVTNTRIAPVTLDLRKTVIDDATYPVGGSFEFVIEKQEGAGWTRVNLKNEAVTVTGADINAAGNLALTAPATAGSTNYDISVYGLLGGTYRITETAPSSEFTLTPDVNGTNGLPVAAGNSIGFAITNSRVLPVSVKLTKTLSDDTGLPVGGSFRFELQRYNGTSWSKVDLSGATLKDNNGYTIENGELRLSVAAQASASASVTVDNLPAGTYKFVELGMENSTEYTVAYNPAQLDVAAGTTGAFNVTNTRIGLTTLNLKKTVADDASYPTGGTFTFTLESYNGTSWTAVNLKTANANVSGDMSVSDEGRLVLEAPAKANSEVYNASVYGLPAGTYRFNEAAPAAGTFTVSQDLSGESVGANGSHTFEITNSRVLPVGVQLTKNLSDDTGRPIGGTFTFQLQRQNGAAWDKVDLTSAVLTGNNGYTVVNGELQLSVTAQASASASVTVENLPAGSYRFVELGMENSADYTVSYAPAGGAVDVAAGTTETVTITNARIPLTTLNIRKTVVDDAEYPIGASFEFVIEKQSGATWTRVDLNNESVELTGAVINASGNLELAVPATANTSDYNISVYGLLAGTYRVTETTPAAGTFTAAQDTGEKAVAAGGSAQFNITNSRILPVKLQLTKTLIDGTDRPIGGTFTFELQSHDGSDWSKVDLTGAVLTGNGGYTVVGGALQLTLAGPDTQSVTVENLPTGTYRFVELGADANLDYTVAQDLSGKAVGQGTSESFTITNTRIAPGHLSVTKKLEDTTSFPTGGSFEFEIYRLENNNAWSRVDARTLTIEGNDHSTNDAGNLVLTLDAPGEVSAALRYLPATRYRIIEVGVDPEEYHTLNGNTQRQIDSGDEKNITVTNTCVLPISLSVHKRLVDDTTDKRAGNFEFRIDQLVDASTDEWVALNLNDPAYTLVPSSGASIKANGNLQLTNPANTTRIGRIEGLEEGTYRVVEVGVDTSRYNVSGSGTSVTLGAEEHADVQVTNTRKALPVTPPGPGEESSSTSTGGGGGGDTGRTVSSSSSTSTGTGAVSSSSSELEVSEASELPQVSMSEPSIPLDIFNMQAGWSFLSLMFAVLSLLVSLVMIIASVVRRRRDRDDIDAEPRQPSTATSVLRAVTILLGAVPITLFLIMEDLTTKPTALSPFTIIIGAALAVHLVCLLVYKLTDRQKPSENYGE